MLAMPEPRTRQISVRITRELDEWLANRAVQIMKTKADVVRTLMEEAMAKEREEELLGIFKEAARDLTSADRRDRDLVAGSFIGAEEPPE
jgi:predicted DNA-binding protein